jgi:hemolysin III
MSVHTEAPELPAEIRPRFRGLSHQLAFLVAVPLAIASALAPDTPEGRASAVVYGAAVAFMFGASGAYHLVRWTWPRWHPLARRVDHAGIYLMIAGSYTPVGLLILDGSWRLAVLGVVWIGAAIAIVLKLCWLDAPKWLAAAIAISLGWVAVLVMPQVWASVGLAGCALIVAGGIAYTLGGIVYATERPDPRPAVFGYHEVFHALVVAAVALQWAAVAFFVLPDH